MSKTIKAVASVLSSPLTEKGRRHRRPPESFRSFLEDRAPGSGPAKPPVDPAVKQRFVARSAIPAHADVLVAPESQSSADQSVGWMWEDEASAAFQSTIAAPHAPKSFEQRFPAAKDNIDTRVQSEAPSAYAESYMDTSPAPTQQALSEPKEREIETTGSSRHEVADPVVLEVGQQRVDDLLLNLERQACQDSPGIEEAPADLTEMTPAAHLGGLEDVEDDGLTSQEPLAVVDENGEVYAYWQPVSAETVAPHNCDDEAEYAVAEALAPHDDGEALQPVPSVSFPLRIRRALGVGLGLATHAGQAMATSLTDVSSRAYQSVSNFLPGSSMKKNELTENSLLEIDFGRAGEAASDSETPMTTEELKQLKRKTATEREGDDPVGRQTEPSGVVGAVALAPNSPQPQTTKGQASVQNPVVHGVASTTGSDDFGATVTHAPAPQMQAGAARLSTGPSFNAFGAVVRGALLIVGLAIVALFAWLGYDALFGGAATPTKVGGETVAQLDPVSTLTPAPTLEPARVVPMPPASAAVNLSDAEVKELEDLLMQLGATPGVVDGFADAQTQAAVQWFEGIMGYPSTDGTLDKFLQGEIRGIAMNNGIFGTTF